MSIPYEEKNTKEDDRRGAKKYLKKKSEAEDTSAQEFKDSSRILASLALLAVRIFIGELSA